MVARNRNRYEIEDNANGTQSVRDTRTGRLVQGPGGQTELSERDAHDLHQEYIHS